MPTLENVGEGFLSGIRVIELADELGEYCGKLLAGLGADVIKVEPLGGESTRSYGPFFRDDKHPNRSLYFWHYNRGKRSVMLDLETDDGQRSLRSLVESADVLIDTRPSQCLENVGLSRQALAALNEKLIYVRISAFGDDGPWGGYVGSDLVHLALGGVMMNCGYDADPTGAYETPPIAPQMWQSYQITGEVTAIQIMAALNYRLRAGVGQHVSMSVHDCVSKNTETDLPDWVYARQPHFRQTCSHSFAADPDSDAAPRVPGISRTKDGRWLYPYRTYLPGVAQPFQKTVDLLHAFGCAEDLGDPKYLDAEYVRQPEVSAHVAAVIDRFVGKYLYERDVWKDAQGQGMPWAPVRRPEENVGDAHWVMRGTFSELDLPEHGAKLTQINAKWVCPQVPWAATERAPDVGEHTVEVLSQVGVTATPSVAPPASAPVRSKHGKPFALSDVRVLDLSWLLASGGAGRFFTALGADVVKIEHSSRVDGMRFSGPVPAGNREERERATKPIWTVRDGSLRSINRGGTFMEINAGKRSLSLNIKDGRGKEILTELIKQADILIEGFSPGTMDRLGLGYARLSEINPKLVYVQQSGMGQHGTYGALRSYGPTAQAFSGLSEMSGLPAPYPPAGIGYSYLDWFGAYQMATAMMAGLYRQRRTGLGCWIDSSQVETGLFLTGTAILDHSANGREWTRFGNRSPYKAAAPHGAYRAAGEDRWVAIGCFTEEQWLATVRILGQVSWAADDKLINLTQRLRHQDYLDELMNAATIARDPYQLMAELQAVGVPAGVCQTAQDRYEIDPQLRHLEWQVELDQAEIGRWPVKTVPGLLSETPTYTGGRFDRSGPSYGQDTDAVLTEWLGFSAARIAQLRTDEVL